MARSPRVFKQAMPEILARCEGELTVFCQTLVAELLEQFHVLEERLARAEQWIKDVMKRSPLCRKIAAVEGIGPVTATAIVAAVGEAKEFKNGRHLAAWLGLVPRQYSSGGKDRCAKPLAAAAHRSARVQPCGGGAGQQERTRRAGAA